MAKKKPNPFEKMGKAGKDGKDPMKAEKMPFGKKKGMKKPKK